MKRQASDKLDVLRASDHFRDWKSLDDERVCVLCDRTFTGQQVIVTPIGREFKLHCPTHSCHSGIHQWVYPGNPLTSERAYADWWCALGEPIQAKAQA
jgi:hypothetical protein